MDKWLNLPEAASYLGFHRDVIDKAIAEGTFPPAAWGTDSPRSRRWRPEWLDEWLESRRKAA